jgi:hypothetical protein
MRDYDATLAEVLALLQQEPGESLCEVLHKCRDKEFPLKIAL